ncbi:DUF3221 domain-containing protein [Alkalihalobacillus oceani]|uniref:DUF3221 domain-containing protein n=1 Tax=Halalkalibacter oceani TaxID=1653776 RepID=UPI002041035A|nr:DUF3221 domain-containing protein [Halalkalibacter oceani]MCM3762689.1 DUF3221 domain-containing protein [Halalkalibacter oceani]
MRKLLLISVLFIVGACGQGNATSTGMGSTEANREKADDTVIEYEDYVEVYGEDQEELVVKLKDFINENLASEQRGEFYLNHDEREGDFVIQVTKETDVSEVADELKSYLPETDGQAFKVHIDHVTYSKAFLEKAQDEIFEEERRFFKGERKVLGAYVDAWSNKLVLDVSRVEDVDLEALAERFGHTDFITFSEGPLASLNDDQVPVPTAEPYITGPITEVNRGSKVVLVDNLIYASSKHAVIVNSSGEIAFDELNVGDTVRLWVEGGVAESLPAQGSAAFIQVVE